MFGFVVIQKPDISIDTGVIKEIFRQCDNTVEPIITAYEMKVNSYKTDIHLADEGMGSIQAMLLIMRIACVIKRIKLAEENSTITRIV